jgi:uncharacterized membrane protein YgcG
MRFGLAALALAAGLAVTAHPAGARDSYVTDGAGMFSAATVSALNAEIGDFNRQTGKEVVVITTPSLSGRTPQDAAERAFAQNQVNGVMIFLAKAEKVDGIVPDRSAARFFPPGETQSIRQAMRGYFRSGDFDQGIKTGVDLVLGQYRSHLGSLRRTSQAPLGTSSTPSTAQSGGFSMGWIWLILIALAAFLIIRALFRAIAGPRMYPPGYGGPGYGPGMGMGGPGYGYGGGGGSFWSGLLGGLGGAFIGNELFGRGGGFGGGGGFVGGESGLQGGDPSQSLDSQGWQSDAGQADMGNASFGDFGDSGGGFDAGGGGFDAGGGGDGGGGW